MRVTLIEPTPLDASAFGTRALSAYLKREGHQVRVVFLPGGVEKFKAGRRYAYEPGVLAQVTELCRDADLVGVSFMSNYLERARQLCREIKRKVDAPLIVGGIHPTVMPEACLEFADIVCRGEGELALAELLQRLKQGQAFDDVANLCLRRGGRVVMNPLRPPVADLDSLPFFDFGVQDHYMYDLAKGSVEPMSKELLKLCLPLEPHVEGTFYDNYPRTRCYKTMTTRGCPHHCAFCAEKTLKDLYGADRYLRRRSVEHVIAELEWVRREMPFVESVFAFDDTFLVRSEAEIRRFAALYKERVGLPLHIQASPTTTTPEKIEALVDAGLAFVEMGIQSTSRAGMEAYRRRVSEEAILKAAAIYRRHLGRIHPACYHVILDNPWETTADVAQTLSTVLKLPAPFWLKRSSLVLFPGTELYSRAKAEGMLKTAEDEDREIYNKHLHAPHGSYVNFLMYLAGFSRLPRAVVRYLARPPILRALDKPGLGRLYALFQRVGDRLIFLSKGARALLKGDLGRIRRALVRLRSSAS